MSDMTVSLIEQALRAPSSHNTQPWLFRVRPGTVEVHADRSRVLPVNDPHDRELHISCGAALFNLEVAAARAGVGTETSPLPDPSNPTHLATMSLGGEADAALADALPTRRFAREAFEDRPPTAALGGMLRALADRHEGCHVALVETTARARGGRPARRGRGQGPVRQRRLAAARAGALDASQERGRRANDPEYDFENRTSMTMIVHTVGSIGSFAVFLMAAFSLPRVLGRFSEMAAVRVAVSGSRRGLDHNGVSAHGQTPGLGQRLGFACFFLWVGLVGYALHRDPAQGGRAA